jgi:formate--tetrahydrofolate ligase
MNKPLDPKHQADWQIARAAESKMKTIYSLADELGLLSDELLPHGNYLAKIDYNRALKRLETKSNAKYIDVTAINPTPLGEGKSTTTIGLVQGLAKRGCRSIATLRQPSGGPTMNIKGSAAGGGLSQVIPLTPFSLGLTGDINAIMNAHNLAMVALTSRMQHEFNYDDAELAKRKLRRINVDPHNVQFNWIIDFCAQALRKIIIGIGGKMEGFMMESRFAIAVSSEIMAILALATDLRDFRERMARIVVAYDKQGNPITTADLEVDGAMTAWMLEALNPNLLQTIEGQPVLVHAGPFANIAIGQSSIIADRLAAKLGDYLVTESGFGADIGFEKFWNLKCRNSGMIPNAAVVVATIRALKCHGGAPIPVPGRPIPEEYNSENIAWVEQGCDNLIHHINTVKLAGINPVVCLNGFEGDTPNEIAAVRRIVEALGARFAYSQHWAQGGEGALELADAVMDACQEKNDFKFLYDLAMPLSQRIERIAQQVYGATGVDYSDEAKNKLRHIEADPSLSKLGTCMVKTHLSLTDDPNKKGVPENWRLFIRDFLIYQGAGFVCPVAGAIKLMPGTSSDPAFRRIDVDVTTGEVTGLF